MGDRWRRHHEVSILIAGKGGVGRYFGSQPRAKVSMMIMRLPQHGHGCGSTRGYIDRCFWWLGLFCGSRQSEQLSHVRDVFGAATARE